VLHALVLAAIALVIFGGAEYFGAKQTVPFGLECPVVDGFGLLDLPEGPFPDLLRRSQGQTDAVIASWISGLCEEIV
jgi:hypothetical protein